MLLKQSIFKNRYLVIGAIVLAVLICVLVMVVLVPKRVAFMPFFAAAATTAGDEQIRDVSAGPTNFDAEASGVSYTYTFTPDVQIQAGQAIYIGISGVSEENPDLGPLDFADNNGSALSATFDARQVPATIEHLSGTAAVIKLTTTDVLNAGEEYTFLAHNITNPSPGCHRAVATTNANATLPSSYTYTDADIAIGTEDGECSSGNDEVLDVPLSATSYGTIVKLDWDPASIVQDEQTFQSNRYALLYAGSAEALQQKIAAISNGDESVIEKNDITATHISLTGLSASTTYYFAIAAYYDDQFVGYTQTSASKKTGKSISTTKMSKPSFSPNKKDIKKSELKARWTRPSLRPTSYTIEVRTSGGKIAKTQKNVSSTATSKVIKQLKTGTKYKMRIMASFSGVYNVNSNKTVTVKTKWTDYSKVVTTKKK